MAKKTANIMVRMEPEVKAGAEAVLDDLGISVSAAVNMLFKQIIKTGSIPFDISVRREPYSQVLEEETAAQEILEEISEQDFASTEIPEEKYEPDREEPVVENDDFSFPENISRILTIVNRR